MSIDVGQVNQAASSGAGALNQISASVVKQILDVQNQQGQAIVNMINQSTGSMQSTLKQPGVGENIDISI